MAVFCSTGIMTASIGSHSRLDIDRSIYCVSDDRRKLIETAFPYLRQKKRKPSEDEYKIYFDELDAIEKAKAEAQKANGQSVVDHPEMV